MSMSLSIKLERNRKNLLTAMLITVTFICLSMQIDPVNQQKNYKVKDPKSDILERIESGEKITYEELKSAFAEDHTQGRIEDEPNDIEFPDCPSFSFDETMPDYRNWEFSHERGKDLIPEGLRDEISRIMEEMHINIEKFKSNDWQKVLDEMKNAMENMKKEMEKFKKEYENKNDKKEDKHIEVSVI